MNDRVRALDEVDNLSDWSVRNPIFSDNINTFDDAFTLEKGLNPKYYVTHGEFENEMCEILFSTHTQRDAKIEILIGNVGSGKTTFASYMGNYKLNDYYKNKNVFYLHLNCYNRYTEKSTLKDFEDKFVEAFYQTMVNPSSNALSWKFKNEYELVSDIAKEAGFPGELEFNEFQDYHAELSPDRIMRYLSQKKDIDIIFIVIDNIDEIPKSAQEIAFAFSLNLSDIVQNSNKLISILIPLRQYTDKAIDTERYYKKDMAHYLTKDIMIMKLNHVKDIFNKSYNHVKYLSESTIYKLTTEGSKGIYKPHISHRTIIVENILPLFESFIKKIPDKNPHSMLKFIESISSGNLKLVTKNTYNFFHSCKLNLTHMMQFSYTPREDNNYKLIQEKMEKELYGTPIIYDLLMAIHYPFYDVDATNIVNVYNLSNSKITNDFRNTLALPRLLNYLYNRGEEEFSSLKIKINSIGYNDSYFERSIVKGLEYCLLDVQHGTKLEHLSDDTSIKLSQAGIYMIENIITDHRYLSYVCEDTPMEKEYIVSIHDKYEKGNYRGSLDQRHLSVEKFYQFIKQEENSEIEFIDKNYGINSETFLREFSFKNNSNMPIKIHEKIKDTAIKVAQITL